MKKLLLFLAFAALFAAKVFSQGTVRVTPENEASHYISPDSGKLTANKIYEDLKEGLKGAAKALKTPVEHVYKVLVVQQVVEAIIYVIASVVVFILCLVFFKMCRAQIKKYPNPDDSETGGIVLFGLLSAGSFIAFVFVFFGNLSTMVTGFANPEYGAIKEILRLVK